MTKKVIYEGYLGKDEYKKLKRNWGRINIANVPHLFRFKYNPTFWGKDGWPPQKVKITIEGI